MDKEADYFGKKKKKWGKKKGLPKYVKKGSKSHSRRVVGNFDPLNYKNMDQGSIYRVVNNPRYEDLEKFEKMKWKDKCQGMKELKTHAYFSANKRGDWKELSKLKDGGRKCRDIESSDEEGREETSYLVVDDAYKDSGPYASRSKYLCNGYRSHIEWFEENDIDYLEYVKNNKVMTKLSKKKQKRLKDKLRTIEYCKKELRKIEKSKYVLETGNLKDRGAATREFIKGRSVDVERLWYKRRSMLKNPENYRVIVNPKSKKRRDINNYLGSYFSRKLKTHKGGVMY